MRPIARIAVLIAITAVYVVTGKLGLQFAVVHASATAVWAPTGIALASFLVFGNWVWPAIFVAAFTVNVTTEGTMWTSLGIALGNTLEGFAGAALASRFAGGTKGFDHSADVLSYAVLVAGLSTTISPTLGVTSLAIAGFVPAGEYAAVWLTWWIGDANGALLVGPALILWLSRPLPGWNREEMIELTALVATTVVVALMVFGGLPPFTTPTPLAYLCLPPLLWAAFRFTPREAAAAALVLGTIAVRGTVSGNGPFGGVEPTEASQLLVAFLAVVAITTLLLAAAVAERRLVRAMLMEQALRDPLTELANYRGLAEVLETELRRSDRTGRPFAVLLLDLDELKAINDQYGHLVGSEALRRLAKVLKDTCRALDTAARFGGDEFAVVLPETEEAAALAVAHRIRERLARDGGTPTISVSVGLGLYPRDGRTVEELLGSADKVLYEAKATGRTIDASRVRDDR